VGQAGECEGAGVEQIHSGRCTMISQLLIIERMNDAEPNAALQEFDKDIDS